MPSLPNYTSLLGQTSSLVLFLIPLPWRKNPPILIFPLITDSLSTFGGSVQIFIPLQYFFFCHHISFAVLRVGSSHSHAFLFSPAVWKHFPSRVHLSRSPGGASSLSSPLFLPPSLFLSFKPSLCHPSMRLPFTAFHSNRLNWLEEKWNRRSNSNNSNGSKMEDRNANID